MNPTPLHIIKVYQGTYSDEVVAQIAEWKAQRHQDPRHEDTFNHPEGFVDVIIRDNSPAIHLALLSYEPVIWRLVPDTCEAVRTVFISSYHPSDIHGEPSHAKVLRRNYREKEKDALVKEIEKDTGFHVASFQDSYMGKKFIVS